MRSAGFEACGGAGDDGRDLTVVERKMGRLESRFLLWFFPLCFLEFLSRFVALSFLCATVMVFVEED